MAERTAEAATCVARYEMDEGRDVLELERENGAYRLRSVVLGGVDVRGDTPEQLLLECLATSRRDAEAACHYTTILHVLIDHDLVDDDEADPRAVMDLTREASLKAWRSRRVTAALEELALRGALVLDCARFSISQRSGLTPVPSI